MQLRDRVREFRRVPARQLRANPKNWRLHPSEQQAALRGVLDEIGFAGALLVRELADGSLELIDGHLRAECAPDAELPVLVLDLSADEADKLLALYDPLGAMAVANQEQLAALLKEVETNNADVQSLLDELVRQTPSVDQEQLHRQVAEIEVPELFQVVVECADESQQRTVYEQLSAQGLRCRVITL